MIGLIDLYPRAWRDRYEIEFVALLAERPPDIRDRLDVMLGAIDARLHPQVQQEPSTPTPEPAGGGRSMSGRALGWVTLAAGIVWLGALVIALSGPIVRDPGGDYRDGGAALPFGLLAMVLLSIGIFGVIRDLPRGAGAGALAGAIAIVVGPFWAAMPWVLPALFGVMAAWVVLAMDARRVGAWRSLDAAIVVVGVVVSLAAMVVLLTGMFPIALAMDSYAILWVALTSVFVGVGHALVTSASRSVAVAAVADRPDEGP
jgi:hypothetical protein